MRYGYDEGLVDFTTAEVVPVSELLSDILDKIHEDADVLGCSSELERVLDIPARGSSAHKQLAIYQAGLGTGLDPLAALYKVVDWLMDETINDL
jgi:carboxylate-amine ligase